MLQLTTAATFLWLTSTEVLQRYMLKTEAVNKVVNTMHIAPSNGRADVHLKRPAVHIDKGHVFKIWYVC